MTLPGRRPQPSPELPDPFAEFANLYDRMGQLLPWAISDRIGVRRIGWLPSWSPAADLSETNDAYIVDVNLPGVPREGISIEIHGEDLVITGEFKDPERAGTLAIRRRARPVGRFESRTTLPGPFDADQVSATLSNGVLTIILPKTQVGKPRQVHISAG